MDSVLRKSEARTEHGEEDERPGESEVGKMGARCIRFVLTYKLDKF